MRSSALIMFVAVALAAPILSAPVAAPSEILVFDREPEPITLGFPLRSGLPVPFSNQGLPLPASAQPTVSSSAPAPFFTPPPLEEKERRQISAGGSSTGFGPLAGSCEGVGCPEPGPTCEGVCPPDGIIFGSGSTPSPAEATTTPPLVVASVLGPRPSEASTAPPQVVASFFSSLFQQSTQAVATNTPNPAEIAASIVSSVDGLAQPTVDNATPVPSST